MAAWVALHKRLRDVRATGRLVRSEHPDPGTHVTGVVGPGRDQGWYVVAQTDLPRTQQLAPVLLEGLDPGRRYRVTDQTPTSGQHSLDLRPSLLPEAGVVVPARCSAGSA